MPTTIDCIENKAGYSTYVSRVVLPCGIIVNKDATAIYYVVTTTFLAQLNMIELSAVDYVVNTTISIILSAG